jgi:DNA-binding NarL/FixJ family response regulator/Tfp pilus assembly protein PilF
MATEIQRALYLIIDDFAAFRQSVKHMLLRMGVPMDNILQASNAEEAWKYIELRKVDVVLCDYNLGPGMNGQQLLEKITVEHRLRPDMIFIMFTAETSPKTVLAVIEYEPSAYLSKPFSREQLEKRLVRLFAKNKALVKVHAAIQKGEVELAIKECDAVIQHQPKYRFAALKTKAQLLEELGRLDQALACCQETLKQRDVLWARMLLGKIFYQRGQYEDAIEHFRQLNQKNPQLATVLDWLALSYEALGKNELAIETLRKAVVISPLNARRQLKLAYLLEKSGDFESARAIYESTMNDNLYSCALRASHFQHYFDITRKTLCEDDAADIAGSAIMIYKKCEEKYKDDPVALAANQLAVARLLAEADLLSDTERFLHRTKHTLLRVREKIEGHDLKYMRDMLDKLGTYDTLAERIEDIKTLLQQIEENYKTQSTRSSISQIKAAEKSLEGDKLADINPSDALEKYSEAFWLDPNNEEYKMKAISTILNSPSLRSDPVYRAMAKDILRITRPDKLTPMQKAEYERFSNALKN